MRLRLKLRGKLALDFLDRKPKLPADLVIKKKGAKVLFLSPSKPAWVVTNRNGATALKLCNGKRTIRRIGFYSSLLALKRNNEELSSFFEKIATETELFSEDAALTVPELDERKPQPRIVQFVLTEECNLNCVYCCDTNRNPICGELKLDDYKKIIDDVNGVTKCADIVLTGGEPLLSSMALDIARHAKSNGNKVHLLTNALLVNENNANEISEAFDLIRISVDGSNQEMHEFHRGKNTYDRLLKAIYLLDKQKAPMQFAMTVTKKNISDIDGMVKAFGSRLTFQPIFKVGAAKGRENLHITGDEYYKALASVKGVNHTSYLCSSITRSKDRRMAKCAIGDAVISIAPNGDMYPCHLLHFPEFRAGNIKEQPLAQIYENSAIFKECRNLTVDKVGGCSSCDVRYFCGGSCRARSYLEGGRVDVADEFCTYEQLSFNNGLFDLHEL